MKTSERIFWFVVALLIGVFISAGQSIAADAPASPPAAGASPAPAAPAAASPSPAPTPTASPPFFSGYLDGAAMSLSGTGFFASNIPDRVFDTKRNGVLGNTANMLFQIVPSAGLGGKLELNIGNDANVFASYPNITHQSGFDITQAYGSWTNTPGNFTLIAGKFSTLAGAEVIESPSNSNYSRSILFGYAVPFTHTGLRATFTASPKVTLIAGVNRGWDQVIGLGGTHTLEGGLDLTPSSTTSLNFSGYTGQESTVVAALGSSTGTRNLLDIVGTWKPPGPIAWTLNYDYGTQANAALINSAGVQTTNAAGVPQFGSASWNGLAGYATYTINPKWAVTLRGEYFNDANGYRTGIAQTWNEGTLSVGFTPNANILLRAEVRGDSANNSNFIKNLNATGNTAKNQSSFAFEAVGKF